MAVMQQFHASVRPVPRRIAASASGTPYRNLVINFYIHIFIDLFYLGMMKALCLAASAPFSCLSLVRILSWHPQSIDR